MRHVDFAPLYRASVGFDQVAELIDRVFDTDQRSQSYPPYNIEKIKDDGWRISIAVAGFSPNDLSVEVKESALVISASKPDADNDQNKRYLHRGIAARSFERRFTLADHVRVEAASHEDGMLNIDLVREIPEALRPRQIPIHYGTQANSAGILDDASKIN